jgi:hypothetical protein
VPLKRESHQSHAVYASRAFALSHFVDILLRKANADARKDLVDGERAYFYAIRKDAYERVHPETAHGAIGKTAPDLRVANLANLKTASRPTASLPLQPKCSAFTMIASQERGVPSKQRPLCPAISKTS